MTSTLTTPDFTGSRTKETRRSPSCPREIVRGAAKNDPNASFCQNCGQALSQEAFEELEREEGFSDEVTEKVDEMDIEGSLDDLIEQAVEERVKEEMKKVREKMFEGEESP